MVSRRRLLVDVDDVLADFQTPVFEIIERVLGKTLTAYDYQIWDMFTLFPEDEVKLIHAEIEKPGFCLNLKPKPGSIEAIRKLRTFVDVYPVTSPFHSEPWVNERTKWLFQHFEFRKKEVTHTGSKFLVEGDAILEDNPEHITTWAEEHPGGLPMLWHVPNTRTMLHLDKYRVHSWDDVIKRVRAHAKKANVYELLRDREWTHDEDGNNFCQECGASAPHCAIPTAHNPNCRVDEILTRYVGKDR
jgi:5'(3')-deoxyribonucleotidase